MSAPVKLIHDGGGNWRAANAYHAGLCDAHYEIGEPLTMVEHHDRSMSSHRHYFACIREVWRNLPERLQMEPYAGSPDHLRKHALIMCGYRESHSMACASVSEARRVSQYLRSLKDDYSVTAIRERAVTRFTAKSQSLKAMGKKDFQESKDATLTWMSELIGTDVTAPHARADAA